MEQLPTFMPNMIQIYPNVPNTEHNYGMDLVLNPPKKKQIVHRIHLKKTRDLNSQNYLGDMTWVKVSFLFVRSSAIFNHK
jgi:hypothetical protein